MADLMASSHASSSAEHSEWSSDEEHSSVSEASSGDEEIRQHSDDEEEHEEEDVFHVDIDQTKPAKKEPLSPRRRGRNSSFSGGDSHEQSARAYAEALRSARHSSHRGSISIAAGAGAVGGHLSEETRRRHRDSKKRMECADRTQMLLFQAHELDARMEDMPLWLHAFIIPPRWRVEIMKHLAPIHEQMAFCRDRVLHAWKLLLPPFDKFNVQAFEKRLKLFDKSVIALEAAIAECEQHVSSGERESACVFLQIWYRRQLARRGFYTKTLQISRHHRGLIPGMFDTIAGTSKLTINRKSQNAKLEYPISDSHAKHAFAP